MELPLELADAEERPKPKSAIRQKIAGLAPGQASRRILIAEDQPENARLLTQLMTELGFDVKLAENGALCLELFNDWRPDLIWMDRRMPVMDGEEATRRIRGLPGGERVKIVAVTASAFKEQQQELLAAGMNDIVRKPYRFEEIHECLTRQLGVEYRYRDEPMNEAGMAAEAVLDAKILAELPVNQRRELRGAAVSLDSDRIESIVGEIQAVNDSLGRILFRLADAFDYPAILNALDQAEQLKLPLSNQGD